MYLHMKGSIILFFLLFFLFTTATAQNQIVLKDSTVIVGKILEITDSLYVIQTEFGNLNIPTSRIARIIFQEKEKPIIKDSVSTEPKLQPPREPDIGETDEFIHDEPINITFAEFKRLKTKHILEGLAWQFFTIFEFSNFLNSHSKTVDLSNSFDDPDISVIFTAGEIYERKNEYIALQIGAGAVAVGSYLAFRFIKLDNNIDYSSPKIGGVFVLSGLVCTLLGNLANSNASEKLEKAISTQYYNKREDYLNAAGKKLSKATNWHLVGTVLLETGSIIYMIEPFTIGNKYDASLATMSFHVKSDHISGSLLPTIRITF